MGPMIISGQLQHDCAGRAVISPVHAARIAELDARRRAAEATLGALVASWQGRAAHHHGEGWQACDAAARDAIDALAALLGALDLARREIAGREHEHEHEPTVPRQADRREVDH
jgi:uncharacterized protein YukE